MGSHWSAVMGGAQYQAKCIIEELLQNRQYKIYYLARIIDKTQDSTGYQIIQIASNKGIRKYGYLFDAYPLTKILSDIKPDVIYQRGLKAYTGILSYYAMRHRCRFIFHIAHDYDVIPTKSMTIHRFSRVLEKLIGEYGLRRANYVIAQTKEQHKYLIANYHRTDGIIIPNFHPYPLEPIEKSQSIIRVVWVANFKSIKRPELFVKLAEELKDYSDVEFVMIGRHGDNKQYGDLHTKISKLKNLHYLGERAIDEVNKILANAHLFINTSIAEGFPNTFIQAWMRQVPVISVSVNTDGVLDGKTTGIYGGDYEGMKEAVVKLIKNSSLRNSIGQRAQAYAFEKHSTKNVQKLIELVEH
jgi:glycosyltransferase involved in cell wall biosynthesis